jgi:diguanylate cyclase (GGDEF)-like protein
MLKIDSKPESRVVLLTVCLVALAGLLVSTASYLRTRSLAASYDSAMETELRQKGLAYGQTAQSLLNAVASASPQAFQSLLSVAANDPNSLISSFSAGPQGQFQDVPLGFEAWIQSPSAAAGYALLFRRDLPGGRIITAEDAGILPLVTQTAATSQPATSVDANDKDLHYSFLIQATDQTNLIVVATLDASEEFAFISAQRQHAIRDAIIFSASSVAFVCLVGGALSYLVSRTLTNRKRAEEALREQARRDSLTGLLNHAAIIEELRVLAANEGDGGSHAVAMVDVDGLKAINDTYGHQIGDAALVAVAKALSEPGAVVGRYAGDEFMAVLPGADRSSGERYREAVLEKLASARLTDPESGSSVPVAATIGLAICPDEAESIADLLRISDSAMYAAKRQRPVGPAGETLPPPLRDDRAAKMVGEIVPLLTSPGDLSQKLRLVAHRLSVGAGYDAVDFSLFPPDPGVPLAQTTFAPGPGELVEAWNREQRSDSPEPHPLRLLFGRTSRPVILDDPWNTELLLKPQRDILRAGKLRSVLVAPMIWQDQLVGSLGVASTQEAAFGPRDAQFLAAVATQVTAIVRMATLVDELQASSTHLEQAHEETVLLLAAAAEAHDGATGQHLQRVQALAEALARELGQSEEEARALGTAAVLHDIGKLFVPETVLTSAGPLDDAGWELMKRHTTLGQQFLIGHAGFELATTIARHHHERWDSTGYPDRLAGEEIPEPATIVTVADAFDAITSGRPYRAPRSVDSAIAEISACSGTQFSPRVVEALLRLHERGKLPVIEGEARRAA